MRISAELIIRAAKACGYSTRMMTDTRSLGDALKQNGAEVVTLDLSMPDADGIETLDVLRGVSFSGHLIIISGHRECLREYACEMAKTNGLKVAGSALLLVSFARLALNPAVLSYHARSTTPIFNWLLLGYGVPAAGKSDADLQRELGILRELQWRPFRESNNRQLLRHVYIPSAMSWNGWRRRWH
jgi:CheY-like chemotaxis protein